MTVGELKKLLAQHEDDIECVNVTMVAGESLVFNLDEVTPYLFDGLDIFDFDESEIDPGHLRKVLVF